MKHFLLFFFVACLLNLVSTTFTYAQNQDNKNTITTKENEVVIIDKDLPDQNVLLESLKSGIKIEYFDSSVDMLTSISNAIKINAPIKALHIVSHGAPGMIFTTSDVIDLKTMQLKSTEIRSWKKNFLPDAEILLYGCETASGDVGIKFIETLSSMSMAKIAASINPTGNKSLDADWILEKQTVKLTNPGCFTEDINKYSYKLAKVYVHSGARVNSMGNTVTVNNYYNSLPGHSSTIGVDDATTIPDLSTYSMVFINNPDRAINAAELNNLKALINRGGRVVFVGENSNFSAQNTNITNAVIALGGHLSIQSLLLDGGIDYQPVSNFNTSSPIMEGVNKLWGNAVSAINIGGDATVLNISVTDPTKIVMAQERLGIGDIVAWADVNFWDKISDPLWGTGRFFRNLLETSAANIQSNTIATLTTTEAYSVGSSTAWSGGSITNDNGSAITQRGICWSTSTAMPTVSDSKVVDSNGGLGSFALKMTGLSLNTKYYVRSFATSNLGTAYGNTISFTTPSIINTAPTAVADVFSCPRNGTISGNVMSNDFDDDGDPMTAAKVINVSYNSGTFTLNSNGTFTYTNNGNAAVSDFFTYFLSDGKSKSGAVGVSISIYTPTTPPTGGDGSITTLSNGTYTFKTSDFTYNSQSGSAFNGITVNTLPANGVLKYNGMPISMNATCSDITKLTFDKDGDTGSNPFASFTFKVLDFNSQPSTSSYTMTINLALQNPTVTTQSVSSIASTTATGNGNVTSLGVPNPMAHGICWNTTGTPTITDSKVDNGAKSSTGAFTVSMTSLSENTTYYVRAYATNSAGTSYGSEVSFTTLAANSAPTDISISASSVNENVAGNTTVGTFSSTDPDTGNTFTYTLVSGTGSTDNASFNISGNSLRISNSPDFETKSSYSVRIRTTNQGSLTYEEAFTITINDVNETPTDISISASSVNENVADNTTVGTFSSTDPDTGNTFTYTLVSGTGSTDNASFNISGNSLRINNSPDFETKSSYSVRVRTTDQGDLSFEKVLTVTINNVADAPLASTIAATNVSGSGATLNGTINANNLNTVVTFEYGLTAAYGSSVTADQSPVTGSSSTSVSKAITGLTLGTTYHYRVKGVNADGTTYGADQTFTTINTSVQTITFPAITAKTYGDATFTLGDATTNQNLTVTYSAEDPSVVNIAGNQATILKAGTTKITATQAGDDKNFAATPVEQTLTVNKATLTVTADAKTKEYGEDTPLLTFRYSGWRNGENETVLDTKPTVSTTVDRFANVGTYSGAIVVSGAVDNNYTFNYVPAVMEVKKATLTVTADNKTKAFGEANPKLTFQYSGWVNGEEVIDISPLISTTVNQSTAIGNYAGAITLDYGFDNNYFFKYVAGNFEVTGPKIAGDTNGDGKITAPETAGDKNGNGIIDGNEVGGDTNGNGVIDGSEIAGDKDGNGKIDGGEIAGDKNNDGKITAPELAGDKNGNGIIDGNEVGGDTNGNGVIDGSGIAGDTNGNGKIDGEEIAGDKNNDGKITVPELAGDKNGNGIIDGNEVGGDTNGNGTIDGSEIAGDKDGNGKIDGGEIAGDKNNDGKITAPELAGDKNGNGIIDGNEVGGDTNGNGVIDGSDIAGDKDGNGKIDGSEIAGDKNNDGKITAPELAGDKNGNGIIDGNEVGGDTNGNGVIDGIEVAGDKDGNGKIDGSEIAGDKNNDGKITAPELAGDKNGNGIIDGNEVGGDTNGNGVIDGSEIAGDTNGNGKIDGSEIAGDKNNDGKITAPELNGDNNGNGVIDGNEKPSWPTGIDDTKNAGSLSAYSIRNTEIRLKGQVSAAAVATLIDMQGRTILVKDLEEGTLNSIPTPYIKTGTYLLMVKDEARIQIIKVPVRE